MLLARGAPITPEDVTTRSRAAPIKGMNTADMVTALEQGFAQRLDNWLCRSDGLHVRNGFRYVANAGSPVTALLSHGETVLPLTDGDWMGAHVSNPGGLFLFAADGEHAPRVHNGSAWTTATITGVDATKLVCPVWHGNRVFAIERDTLTVWYLGVDAIGGPAQPVYTQMLVQHGGALTALVSTGNTLLAVTDRGELIQWTGRNPAMAGGWAHGGTFQVPKPVGRRCFAQMGAGVALLTVSGLLPVPQVLAAAQSGKDVTSISRNVDPTMTAAEPSAVMDSGALKATLIECDGHLYARSAETGGWSRLYGWNATAWCETPAGLYFGRADGKVCKVEGFYDDDGNGVNGGVPIATVMADSYSPLGYAGHKRMVAVLPHFKLAHQYTPRIEVVTDYRNPPADWPSSSEHMATPHWRWHELVWSQMPEHWRKPISARSGKWRGLAGEGRVAALMMGCLIRDADAVFIGADYRYRRGGLR